MSKDEGKWRELDYLGIEFKRVSASRNVLWAVGGDHQVYVFVYGVELPIRVKEITYENERWNPMEGFCSKLLPTDRSRFSNMGGTQAREKDRVRVAQPHILRAVACLTSHTPCPRALRVVP